MLRPPPRDPHAAHEVDYVDSGSFCGLADVLEPDPDAITSMRNLQSGAPLSLQRMSLQSRAAPLSVRGPLSVRAPISARAPIQVQDLAFADTVFGREDDEPAPPSGPIFVNDSFGNTQCVTPLAFPLPPAADDADALTRLRVMASHVRHAILRAREEMRELWAGTAEIVHVEADAYAPAPSPFSHFVRRALALWSCFQWSRADLTRAAMIGGAVFLIAATIGAVSIDMGDAAGAAGSEVRAGRTLDQHTGHKIAVRNKR